MRRSAILSAGLLVASLIAAIGWIERNALVQRIGPRLAGESTTANNDLERAALERKYEAKFDAPRSGCAAFGSGRSPQLCIERLTPESVALGSPVALRLRWRNLSPDQLIRLRVTSAAPLGTRFRYSGPQGAITAQTFGRASAGDERITWDGKSLYCAPADAPMMCDAGNVGRFQIEALAFTGDDPFWPSWPPVHPVPTKFVVRSEALPIEFTGIPVIVRPFGGINLNRAFDGMIPPDLAGTGVTPWKLIEQAPPVYATFAYYCSDYRLPEPLQGTASLCVPKSARDLYGIKIRTEDFSVSGRPSMATGVIPARDAKAIAERAAAAFLRGKVMFDHYPEDADRARAARPRAEIVYLQQDQTNAQYLGERSWLVSVDQVARDLAQGLRSDFMTYYYRIGSDRRPCLIAAWNRTQNSGSRPARNSELSQPCI